MVKITSLRHAFPERAGFEIERKTGIKVYTFLHFFNSVKLLSNGKLIKTLPDACIIYSTDVPQYFKSEEMLVHDWMHFTVASDIITDKYGLNLNTVFYPKQTEFITEIISEMENEFFDATKSSDYLLDLKWQELMFKLGRNINLSNQPSTNKTVKKQIFEIRNTMFLNLNNDWTVEKLAKTANLSPSYFLASYKSLYGISPINDLINARLNYAKDRLLTSNDKIKSISEELGYNNVTHFIRQFKKLFGVSPEQYRKNK